MPSYFAWNHFIESSLDTDCTLPMVDWHRRRLDTRVPARLSTT